jgi:hypothetical protein
LRRLICGRKRVKTKILFIGGYFGSTFISRLPSWPARDESGQCCTLGLADAAVSPAGLLKQKVGWFRKLLNPSYKLFRLRA